MKNGGVGGVHVYGERGVTAGARMVNQLEVLVCCRLLCGVYSAHPYTHAMLPVGRWISHTH